MSYRRFRLPEPLPPVTPLVSPESVATVATVAGLHQSRAGSTSSTVASVATVADCLGSETGPPPLCRALETTELPATLATVATVGVILGGYECLLEGLSYPARKHLEVAQRFLADHWAEARRLGWNELELFACHPDPALALARYDCMGA